MQLMSQLANSVFNTAGEITVTYQPVHFGHGKDIQFLSRSSRERQHTANQLCQNTQNSVIMDNIWDNVDGSVMSQSHLVNQYNTDTADEDTDAATEAALQLPTRKRRKHNQKRRQEILGDIDHLRRLVEAADVEAYGTVMDIVCSCVKKCTSTVSASSVINTPPFVTDKPAAPTEQWNKLTDKWRHFRSSKKARRRKGPGKRLAKPTVAENGKQQQCFMVQY